MGRSPRTESNSRQESTSNKASQGASKLNASNMPLKVDLADDLARVQGQFSPSPSRSPSRRGILKDLSDEDAPAEDAPATPTFSLHRVRSNVDVLYYHDQTNAEASEPADASLATELEE